MPNVTMPSVKDECWFGIEPGLFVCSNETNRASNGKVSSYRLLNGRSREGQQARVVGGESSRVLGAALIFYLAPTPSSSILHPPQDVNKGVEQLCL